METMQRQVEFFAYIAEKYYPNAQKPAFAKDLQTHLHLGKSAAYDRIKGETLLNVDETHRLLQVYEVPIGILLPAAKLPPPYIYKLNMKHKAIVQLL
jgi:hypothetical protein